MWPFSSYPSNVPIIAAKREERDRALEAKDPATTTVDLESERLSAVYLRATASEIVDHIAAGEWTASQVLEAYIERAALAQAKTNCLTEVFFDKGRARAKELDEEFTRSGKVRGPLHGVPISIKDQFEIEGLDATIGFTQWAQKPCTSNADLINHLLDAGAVLFVKTNVPQTMLAFECSNPLWGRTLNPFHPSYTCGGSSGGEAALLAMDGSALGIGSDIGGSLRIPAAYCGIYSLKPGSARVAYGGARGAAQGFEGVKSVAGPMGRSVRDVELGARVLFGKESRLGDVAPVPFREVEVPQKLKFGYYTSDGYIKASPACKRAVIETVEALRKQGHECVEISVPNTDTACNLFVSLSSSDGYQTLLSHLGPDKKEGSLLGPRLPSFLRWLAGWALETIGGDPIFAETLRSSRKRTVAEYYAVCKKRNEFVQQWYADIWSEERGLDGIIGPVQAVPQLPHGGCDNFASLAIGTILYNILDLPVGCLPVTRVSSTKDVITTEWESEPGHGTKFTEKAIYYGTKKVYDPELSNGMPVNVQIVGRKWEDEKVVSMMKLVDEALGEGRGFGPGSYDKYQEERLKSCVVCM